MARSAKRFWTSLGIAISLVQTTSVYGQAENGLSKKISLTFGAEHDSNPRQIPNSPDKDTRLFTVLATEIGHAATYHEINVDYEADYSDYIEDTIDQEYTLIGRSELVLGSQASPLKWITSNTEQETLLSSILPDTPSNSSTRSTFTTGPRISLRLSKVDSVQLQSDVSYTKVERSPVDSKTEQTALSWQRQSSARTIWSLTGSHNKITPDDPRFNAYEQRRAGLGWQYNGHSFRAAADIGANRVIALNTPEDTYSEISFSLQKSWSTQQILTSIERSISNSGEEQEFEELLTLNDIGSQTFELTRRESATLQYSLDKWLGHHSLAYSLTMTRAESLESPNIDKIRYNTLTIDRMIRPSTSAIFNLSYTNYFSRSQLGVESEREEGIVTLTVQHSYSESLNFGCQAGHNRSSTDFGSYNANFASCSATIDLL